MKETGFEVIYDKWFTNLPYTGNVGSASTYIIMEELFCFIPERDGFPIVLCC